MQLTHYSTFSGIGGMDLAAEWAGFETIGQVEKADYPYKVLCKHWPDVPKWRDIRDVRGDDKINNCTVLSGGFPCQPFSTAGKRRGENDDRYLWPELLRIIGELRPSWVIGENVTGIVGMALDKVLADLESKGYKSRAFIIPAIAVNAPHRRNRVFIVANFDNVRCDNGTVEGKGVYRESSCAEIGAGDKPYSYYHSKGLQGRWGYEQSAGEQHITAGSWETSWVEAATSLCGVDDGIPARVDRLKCLGNAVVPQQVYPIFKAIAEIEHSTRQAAGINNEGISSL